MRHFQHRELACHHCGVLVIDQDAAERLDNLRDAFGGPVVVVSGYRCPVHNANVGGASNSLHMKGKAFDLYYGDTVRLIELYDAAVVAGFTGFGFYGGWLHVDTGPRRMWVG